MYHGIPINSEMIAIIFGVIVWIIRGIARGLKQLRRPPGTPMPPPQAAPPQNPFQAQSPGQTLLPARTPQAQAQQERAARLQQRTQPRQPSAGGPAVPVETDRRDFVRQEQELFASEPAALDIALASSSATTASQANGLFSGADDLVRAIILQEVLGPPLSRRKSTPAPPSAAPQ